MKLIDVTVPLDANFPTYPGNTPFQLETVGRRARGDRSSVSSVRMSVHAGTHVDAPSHFFEDGRRAAARALDVLCDRTRVLELTTRKGVTAEDLAPHDLTYEMFCFPLAIVGSDGAPARVVLRRS